MLAVASSSSSSKSSMTTFVIKVEHDGILRRFTSPLKKAGELDLKFDSLKAKIINLFQFPLDAKFSLTYLDEDGDIVTLANDEDLCDVTTQNLKFLRIRVVLNRTDEPKSSSPSQNSVPDSIKECMNQVVSKILLELPIKASSSTQIATELCESISKLGLNFLKNIPNKPLVEVKPPSSQNEEANLGHSPNVQMFPSWPFSETPLERTPIPSKPITGDCHIGVECDECGANPIVGVRYKSQIADDFDLCDTCFSKLGNPTSYEKMTAPVLKCPFKDLPCCTYLPLPPVGACHVGVTCDGCNARPIIGTRYKSKEFIHTLHNLSKLSPLTSSYYRKFDYDLCQTCFSRMGNPAHYEMFETPVPLKPYRCRGFKPPPGHFKRQAKAKLDSRFITDVNVLDGTVLSPGVEFTKIWRLRNNGSIRWPRGTRLMWIGGDRLTATNLVELEIPDLGLPLEKEVDIAVDFSAPILPGRYISYWRLVSPFGAKFGQRVWVLIQVEEPTGKSKTMNLDLNEVPESNPENQTELALGSYPKLEGEPVRIKEETDADLKKWGFKEVVPIVDADETVWGSFLDELFEMGFCDKEQNLKLLRKHNGSISAVVLDMLIDE